MLRASSLLQRAAFGAFATVAGPRLVSSGALPAKLSTSFATTGSCGPTTSLAEARRHYARKSSPHDSNTEDVSNTFFDVQDVDADRLTHFYWDSNDNADTPYDNFLLDSLMSEGAGDEWSGESLAFVDERDQQLLEDEYLR